MSVFAEVILFVLGAFILDWAARWQIENAFAAFLHRKVVVPRFDAIRIAVLAGIVLCTVTSGNVANSTPWAVMGIGLVIIYFVRASLSAAEVTEVKSPPPAS